MKPYFPKRKGSTKAQRSRAARKGWRTRRADQRSLEVVRSHQFTHAETVEHAYRMARTGKLRLWDPDVIAAWMAPT